MTDFTEIQARELFERLKKEGECWHYNEKFSASAYLCDGCGFESTHGTIQNHNPNLLNPDADSMLWMMERALRKGIRINFRYGMLSVKDTAKYGCILDEDWTGKIMITAPTPQLALRIALCQYFKIGKKKIVVERIEQL